MYLLDIKDIKKKIITLTFPFSSVELMVTFFVSPKGLKYPDCSFKVTLTFPCTTTDVKVVSTKPEYLCTDPGIQKFTNKNYFV